jgi:MFS family permease
MCDVNGNMLTGAHKGRTPIRRDRERQELALPMHTPVTRDALAPWPPAAGGWMLAAFLALASIVSQFDRTVVNLMVAPIKAAFDLDDTHFGMLQGVAFGIFYILASIPIGRLADLYPRRLIIAAGLGLFSLFAMSSGLAQSYIQLFLTRIGVAAGEASLTPAGLSMLSDQFPPERLARPVSFYLMSAPIGQGLAFIIGGRVLYWLTTSSVLTTGPLSHIAPWQAAFMIVGFPGLLLVPLFLRAREPSRRGAGHAAPLSVREVLGVIAERRAVLLPMFAGFSMVTLVTYAYFIWTPALLQRSYGWNSAEVGLAFGLVLLVFATGGVYAAGWLIDELTRRGHDDAPLKVAAFGFVGCGVFGALVPWMPNATAALCVLGPAILLSNMPYSCAGTAIQLIIPNRARAQVTAIYITLTTLVGLGVGPLVVGLMTDHLFTGPAGIRFSLALVVSLPAPVMFALLMLACRPYRALRRAA